MSAAISSQSSSTSSSEDDNAARRRRRRKHIEVPAVRILIELPNVTEQNLMQWLYVAREVTSAEDIYMDILEYVNNSQQHQLGIKVLNIVRIVRNNDVEFEHDRTIKAKRMMLWHGTLTNIVPCILQNGFMPPKANGQMFGTGIYFADRASKSANYCDPNKNPQVGNIGYMFLCDVIVGKSYNAQNAHAEYTEPPGATSKSGKTLHFDSVKCTGSSIPDEKNKTYCKGSLMPKGKTLKNTKYTDFTIQFNEYIVYGADKVKPKFLVKIEFQASKYNN